MIPHNTCSAYCRPPEHCSVVWIAPWTGQNEPAVLAEMQRRLDWHELTEIPLRAEPAREAPPPPKPLADHATWLVWWRPPSP